MAEDDIYGNKARYGQFVEFLDERIVSEEEWRTRKTRKHSYRIANPANLAHFKRLAKVFEANDLSYIHRLRQFQHLLVAAHCCEKEFKDCTRDDVNEMVAFMHSRYASAKS